MRIVRNYYNNSGEVGMSNMEHMNKNPTLYPLGYSTTSGFGEVDLRNVMEKHQG